MAQMPSKVLLLMGIKKSRISIFLMEAEENKVLNSYRPIQSNSYWLGLCKIKRTPPNYFLK